jgi:outer membrane receptor protein involved in Fe transport
VVTGGASAAYGSDAVAGVTNLIINRNLTGFRSTLQYGAAQEGDPEEFLGSFAWGTRFGGERGRFVVGGEYVDNQGAGDCYTRDWCAQSYNTVSNPFVAGSTSARVFAGQPATLILPNARTSTASLNGIVIAGPLRGTEFNPNGTTFQHDYGVYGGAGLFQSGGGDPVLPFYQFFPLAAPSERYNLLADVSYALTDRVELFAQGSYGHVEGDIRGASRRDVSPAGSYQIARDNAFLPASVLQQMIAANVQTPPFGHLNDLEPARQGRARPTARSSGSTGRSPAASPRTATTSTDRPTTRSAATTRRSIRGCASRSTRSTRAC